MSSKKIAARPKVFAAVAGAVLLLASSRLRAAGRVPDGFAEGFAEVNGVRLRYLIGGKGTAVVLLHGYAETSHMWDPILPLLAKRHTVIVPDLRGAGGAFLIEQAKLVASDVKGQVVQGSGHWLMEEAPETVIPAIVDFIN